MKVSSIVIIETRLISRHLHITIQFLHSYLVRLIFLNEKKVTSILKNSIPKNIDTRQVLRVLQ
jgi:hypothetical protein